MLVLSRRPGEEIIIGGDVSVTVLEIRGGRVLLGVNAPRTVTIDRSEVHRKKVPPAEVLCAADLASTTGEAS